MSAKGRIPWVFTQRRGGDSWFHLGLLALCLPVVILAGCQKGASTPKNATIQSESLAVAANPASASSEPAAKVEETKPVALKVTVLTPKITVEKPVLDLGEVGTETKLSGKFAFKSTGNTPLKILQVFGCCGVTTRGVEAGQQFAPGESGALEFDYYSGSTPVQEFKRELRLQTNDPDHNLVTFTIKAKVVRRVTYEPVRLRLFLKRDNAGCEDITIHSLDGKPFSIIGFRSTANAIRADFDPNVKATEFTLKPKADMATLEHNLRGMVSIELNHPECSNVRLPFDVLPEFAVNPPHIMVFNLRAGQPVQRVIWVLSNYSEDFEIESVSSQKGIIKLVDKEKVDNRYQLRLEIDPPERENDNTLVADTLEVKIKGGDTESIPFRGFYVGR